MMCWFDCRKPSAKRQALLASGGRKFEPMPGRVMKNYLLLPEASDGQTLSLLLRKAFDHTSQLLAEANRTVKPTASSRPLRTKRATGKGRKR